jgi:outer membrane protein OmpA-like peptidoglycan-associated protein
VAAGFAGALVLHAPDVRANGSPSPPPQGFDVDTFNPSARGSDWFVLDSLDFRDDGRPAAGVVAEYAYLPLIAKNGNGTITSIVASQLFLHPGASIVLLDAVRFSFDLPIAVANSGYSGSIGNYALNAPDQAALGDTAFAADVRLFGRYRDVATGSLGLEVIAPTGSASQYTGDGTARIVPRFQLAGMTGPLSWAARVGVLLRTQDDAVVGSTRGTALVYGASVGWHPDKKLTLGPEVYGNTSLTESSSANSPAEVFLGAHYALADEWRVGAAVGTGISSALGVPVFRSALSLEYVTQADEDKPKKHEPRAAEVPDRDHDTVPDTLDACPDRPGPPSLDASLNGCPPPPDRDGDGITDDIDACPDEKGSPSTRIDRNGCPPDADGDGIADSKDACPLLAGVEQSDPHKNGCPADADNDGIPDAVDACPSVPGVASKDPLDNGCPPNPDRDGDGIPNDEDACPHEAGPKDPDPKKNGCPRAVLRGDEIQILDQVRFDAGSAQITKGKANDAVLEAVAKVLTDHPEITKLEVQGHTDNQGNPKTNKALSQKRAEAVVRWFTAHKFAAARFTAMGYGDERPLDMNTTPGGRMRNRRVEFHATELTQQPAATKPEEKKTP